MDIISCGGHGGSCIYYILLISGYVIDKCVLCKVSYPLNFDQNPSTLVVQK